MNEVKNGLNRKALKYLIACVAVCQRTKRAHYLNTCIMCANLGIQSRYIKFDT